MDLISEENYIIAQAKKAHETDPFRAKAWIITAKTLYPNNFHVQCEAYKIEKAARNYEEAAKCFSYIILTFPSQSIEMWPEVTELTTALRIPEGETTPEQDFFVKLFQLVSYDVQHKILLSAFHMDDWMDVDNCKFVLHLLKRFPQAIATHSPRLLSIIAQNETTSPLQYQELLIQEALPLIYHKTPELPEFLVSRIYTIVLVYYAKKLVEEVDQGNMTGIHDIWKQIFQALTFCGKVLNWPPFLPFNKNWSKDVYWQKIVEMAQIGNLRPQENKQIFFCATTLLVFSLQEYVLTTLQKIDGAEVEFVLVEGFKEPPDVVQKTAAEAAIEHPIISVSSPCTAETQIAFTTAANCWRYLTGTEYQIEFRNLLVQMPLSNWVSRFLFDLAVYFGHYEEAKKLLSEMKISNIRQNIRLLSLNVGQGPLTLPSFNCILKILMELPSYPGQLLDNLTLISKQRHMMLLPLSQKAIVQYCTKAIVTSLQRKIFEPNCPDTILGDLLVLLQLDYPRKVAIAESIFSIIASRTQFTYLRFPAYIITVDFLEEFMHIWSVNNCEYNFEFVPIQETVDSRRIGTRGAEKEGRKEKKKKRDDFKQLMKQQTMRSNDDLTLLIAEFITKEHAHLMENMF